jgi:esterase/lipase superfamily enzyme
MKQASRWFSERIEAPITLVRWGHWGAPVLLFPTAGGDAEECERMQMIDSLAPLVDAGRVKIYSLDSLAGRALAAKWGSEAHRCWLLNRFEEMVAAEIVPAIHADCGGPQPVIAAGASLGAFKAVAVLVRYPELFRAAVGMSGSYDLEALFGFHGTTDYYFAAPLSFLPNLGEGPQLDRLRHRFVILAYGQGRWEDPDVNWRMAGVLGAKGVPNRVDAWGPEWDHDWPTWRRMLPLYLDELTR